MKMILTKEDSVVYETSTTLVEWHKIWKSLYLDHQVELFDKISKLLSELIDLREKLVNLLLEQKNSNQSKGDAGFCQQIAELKCDIVTKLDRGNRILNLDLTLRDANFTIVDPIELSPIKLYRLHAKAANTNSCNSGDSNYGSYESISTYNSRSSILSTTSTTTAISNYPRANQYDSSKSHTRLTNHLQMQLRGHQLAFLPSDELIELYFSIVECPNSHQSIYANARPISEKFLVQLHHGNLVCGVDSTIFTNLGPISNREIYLHVQVYRVGKMTLVEGGRAGFGKQQSSIIQPSSLSQDSAYGSHSSTSAKFNGSDSILRARHSTIGLIDSSQKYRRPFGTAMVKVANLKDTNLNLKVLASSESDFSHTFDSNLKRSHTLKINQNIPNIHLDLSIKFLTCSSDHQPKVFSNGPCLTEKRGFPDIVMPGDFKNDLYFTLESAEFEKGGKSISKNIEATISLIGKTGLIIDSCISPGSNCDNVANYKSCVFYHSNSPKWNESIKINVPLSEFDSAHIRIEFRHCSTKERDKKFLGFSFLPLSDDDGTVIADKSHELFIYKYDCQVWDDESLNLCKYTSLPYGPGAKGNPASSNNNKYQLLSNFAHSNREMVNVSTHLISTKLTQNSNLLNLLRWREIIKRNNKDFEEVLKKVLTLRGEEIVLFLQDILDTLFDTFTLFLKREDDYMALIFKALVHIFLLIDEPEYQQFRPVLDSYVSSHFSATLVYQGLLACINKCLDHSYNVERHVPIQKCFKTIKYVFQFVVQSKILYSKATGEQNDDLFLTDIRRLFKEFEILLRSNNSKLIPIQVTFLESFPGTLEQLMKVMSPIELAGLVTSLAATTGFRSPPLLTRAKLIFMKETASCGLVKSQEARILVTESFCAHIDLHLKNSEELELCYEVLEILIVRIHDYHWPAIYRLHQLAVKTELQPIVPINDAQISDSPVMTVGEINQTQMDNLDLAISSLARELKPFIRLMDSLFQLLDMLIRDNNSNYSTVQKYSTFLLTVLKLMGKTSYEQFMRVRDPENPQLRESEYRKREMDYQKLCNLFKSLRAVYQRDWSILQLTSHSILEHPIRVLFKDVKIRIDTCTLNRQLSSYVNLVVDFITHPTLQLESFSERKRAYVLRVFGDLRLKFAHQLMLFWTSLAPSAISDLIPTSIQPFLDAALLPNDELQQKLIPVFYDMIDAEERFKSNTRQFERCLIDNLDLFMNLDRGSAKFMANFDRILRGLIKDKEPSWEQKAASSKINSFTKLMSLLINYRKSLEECECQSKQMICLVELLKFYKNQDRLDLHLRYLFKLCDMHLASGNSVEAALSLKLYSDELKWCSRILSPLEGYRPEEQEWRRKEVLYLRIIHYFDEGKSWEEAIQPCKELASFYENFLVDYEKVSSILKKLAQFLDNILTVHRPEKEYFRVEFFGTDAPEFLRDKEFVYRGGEYERLASFVQRMSSEFPEFKVLNFNTRQSVSKTSRGQFMVISNVKPVPFLKDQFKASQRNINDKVIHYYLSNRLDTFSYDIPIIKNNNNNTNGNVDKSADNYIKNLWVGRCLLKVRKQLPGILPWSEVVTQEYAEISPIKHAIETIGSMNVELSKLILSYKNDPNKQLSPLTMRLQGVIEAAVNGGPSVFINSFLKDQPSSETSQMQEDVQLLLRLRDLIVQQFSILETGLALHAKLAPPDMMPLHSRLVERLQSIKLTLMEEPEQPVENNYEELLPVGCTYSGR